MQAEHPAHDSLLTDRVFHCLLHIGRIRMPRCHKSQGVTLLGCSGSGIRSCQIVEQSAHIPIKCKRSFVLCESEYIPLGGLSCFTRQSAIQPFLRRTGASRRFTSCNNTVDVLFKHTDGIIFSHRTALIIGFRIIRVTCKRASDRQQAGQACKQATKRSKPLDAHACFLRVAITMTATAAAITSTAITT